MDKQSFKEIARRFTPKFASQLIRTQKWQALSTPEGWFVARMTGRHGGTLPSLAEIRPSLVRDWRRANQGKLSDYAIEQVARDYVFVEDGVASPGG